MSREVSVRALDALAKYEILLAKFQENLTIYYIYLFDTAIALLQAIGYALN
jgi:hypothetical protein